MCRTWSVGFLVLISGCASTPEVNSSEPVRQAIGWIHRQYLTCPESECPQPTRKTLAVVSLPKSPTRPPEVAKPIEAAAKELPQQERIERITVYFQFGKSLPTPQGLKAILHLPLVAKSVQRIELDGRTDDIGSKTFNDRLARQRAEHVRDWLLREGVKAPIALSAEGACCFADNDTSESARQRNRRVEVRLVHRVVGRDAVGNKQGVQ